MPSNPRLLRPCSKHVVLQHYCCSISSVVLAIRHPNTMRTMRLLPLRQKQRRVSLFNHLSNSANPPRYFQCVTDPACDRCTATTSWTNTSAPITSPPSTSSIDYETMKPGTYTFVANGTTRVMVVPATANATAQIVTVTLTTVLTVPFSESASVSAQTASLTTTTTTTTQSACPSYCDCSKIKDKTSDEYVSFERSVSGMKALTE